MAHVTATNQGGTIPAPHTTRRQVLNHDLPLLPAPPRGEYNHAAMRSWLDARHDACIERADEFLGYAEGCASTDPSTTYELMEDAREYLAEAHRIRGMRTY